MILFIPSSAICIHWSEELYLFIFYLAHPLVFQSKNIFFFTVNKTETDTATKTNIETNTETEEDPGTETDTEKL